MTAVHTPWSAIIHAGLTVLGFCFHRDALHTASVAGFHPLAVGPGLVGFVEPCVSLIVGAALATTETNSYVVIPFWLFAMTSFNSVATLVLAPCMGFGGVSPPSLTYFCFCVDCVVWPWPTVSRAKRKPPALYRTHARGCDHVLHSTERPLGGGGEGDPKCDFTAVEVFTRVARRRG